MSLEASDFWSRAVKALNTAKSLITKGPDASASRVYYAAFYTVSALFAKERKTFTKHSAVESAVRRDLVKTRRWPVELGKKYTYLAELRITGDYGGGLHVSEEDASKAVEFAGDILRQVGEEGPKYFPFE